MLVSLNIWWSFGIRKELISILNFYGCDDKMVLILLHVLHWLSFLSLVIENYIGLSNCFKFVYYQLKVDRKLLWLWLRSVDIRICTIIYNKNDWIICDNKWRAYNGNLRSKLPKSKINVITDKTRLENNKTRKVKSD